MIDADNNGRVSQGDTLQYRVLISSRGNTTALALVYTDTPDPNTRLVPGSVQASPGSVISGNTGVPPVTVQIGDLPPGAQAEISYRATINTPLPADVTQIVNQGLVRGTNIPDTPTDDPTTPAPDDPTITPLTPTPILVAEKSDFLQIDANDNGKPSAGDTLIYLITVANRGAVPALSVRFTDDPAQFANNVIFVAGSVVTSQGTIVKGNTSGDTTIEIDLGTIAVGASARINFEVQIKDPVTPPLVKNQGIFSTPSIPPVLTDDPDTPEPNDPTITIIPPGDVTAVQLLSFSASWQAGQVVVRWATGAELNTWGFELYRSADGRRESAVRVTPAIILAQGRGQGGAAYEWIDTSASAGTIYAYWLREIELDGSINEYGPVSLAVR
ncbi:MAG: hypothetical protein U0Z44_04600 [Kouleothrix sp.]